MAALSQAYAVSIYNQVIDAETMFTTLAQKKEYIGYLIKKQPEAYKQGWGASYETTQRIQILNDIIVEFFVGTRQEVLTETYGIIFDLTKAPETPVQFEQITGEKSYDPARSNPGYRIWSGKSMPSSLTKRKIDYSSSSDYAEDSPSSLERNLGQLNGIASRSRHGLIRESSFTGPRGPGVTILRRNDLAAADLDPEDPLAGLELDLAAEDLGPEGPLAGLELDLAAEDLDPEDPLAGLELDSHIREDDSEDSFDEYDMREDDSEDSLDEDIRDQDEVIPSSIPDPISSSSSGQLCPACISGLCDTHIQLRF